MLKDKDQAKDITIQELNNTINLWKPRWDELCNFNNSFSWCIEGVELKE